MHNIREISALLKAQLGPARYRHSVNVMHESVRLAGIFGVDEEKARIAGLLHDCGRAVKKKDSVAAAAKAGIPVSSLEKKQPVLLHAPLGGSIAQKKYGIDDDEILRAIALHTTGGKNMSALDMVVFIADLTEPDRTQPGVETVRALARQNIKEAMLAALRFTADYLLKNRFLLHPACVECWNDLLLGKEQEVS